MERIAQQHSYWQTLYCQDREVSRITFFDNNGIVASTCYGLTDNEKNRVQSITVLNVKMCSNILDKEKLKNFKSKMMSAKEPINFAIKEKGNKCDLFLFIDDEFIKVTKMEKFDRVSKDMYDLTVTISHWEQFTLQILDQTVVIEVRTGETNISTEKYQKQVNKLYQYVLDNNIYGIDKDTLFKLFNHFSISIRPKPILDKVLENTEYKTL